MSAEKPRRLGRGLEALLASSPRAGAPSAPAAATDEQGSALQQLPIAQIRPNPFQPRKEFPAEELAELEASLRANGLLQPITVRPAAGGRGYELIAGERRLRAATKIGWTEITAIVRELDDRALLTLALVENLQRSDLNPLEEAEGYQRLQEEFGLTQQEVADIVGKDRTTVANTLRVLGLPAAVRRMLGSGELTLGHARAILAVGQEQLMVELARAVTAGGLSVRETEQRARDMGGKRRKVGGGDHDAVRPQDTRAPELRRLEDQLRRYLQTDVQLTASGQKGSLTIQFYSADDLDRLMDLVLRERRHM